MNFKMITYVIGWLLTFEAAFMAVPIITAAVYGEVEAWHFVGTAVFCLIIGRLLTFKKRKNTTLYSRDGFVIVALSWTILSIFGAMPFWLSGAIPNYVDALFETVSGFTTTGASILSDVEALPKCMLMWRSFTHWVGGMGVLVFIMAFLPLAGGQNMHIMRAESPGPSVSKLVPRVRTTALILYAIYFVLTVIEFILLLCGGMTIFEATNTAFATAGTGGFGFLNSSMGSFSPYIQIVITVFMLLFSINFNSYFFILLGRFKDAFTTEVRTFLIIVATAITAITINISPLFESVGEALRHSSFTVASLISTTGFSTVDFDLWPEFSKNVLVLIMFIGACAGSTGGGIKVSRIIILFKSLGKELRTLIHPREVKKLKIDGHIVEHETLRSVNVYMVSFVLIFVFSIVAISFDNHDFITNFTAVTATINNIGPGLEMVGPTCNFGFFSIPSKLVFIFDMLAGRLELFPMLVLFTPATWKK
ncbi:MAG: TrkH family potassium uptake protein [Clostridia bacterium]|nr:TrkH family potassium uptake protein [Clostridia bacterium]MBQ8170517.1 TrkH family potassium uptake protein [Oscillospiraceae bacterium]